MTFPSDDPDESERESDRLADAMKDRLRKDVASWSKARSGDTPDLSPLATGPGTKKSASPAGVRVIRKKPKPVAAPTPVTSEKKPFRMSYDGTTDRAYNAERTKLRIK